MATSPLRRADTLSEPEGQPLLPTSPPGGRHSTAIDVHLVDEPEEVDTEEATAEDEELFADRKKRGTSLILIDAVVLLVHTVQMVALLQSLAIRWPFPREWMRATYFLFLFNLDVWEFAKIYNNATYREVQGYSVPSAAMPFQYWHVMAAWGALVVVAVLVFVVTWLVLTYRRRPFLMLQLASLQRVYIVLVQLLSLPLGTAIMHVFHCTGTDVMDVDNTVPCYADGLHWAYICPSAAVALVVYALVPAWMIVRTRGELLNLKGDRHEGYLQLKEVEYVQGLDTLYLLGHFHMFASFKKNGAHLRALTLVVDFCFLLVAAVTFQHFHVGAIVVDCLLVVLFFTTVIVRPYRVACFNVLLAFSYLCMVVYGLLGALRTSFTSFSLASAWLTPSYLNVILAIVAVFWLAAAVGFVVYLVLRHLNVCLRCCPHPLWPSMTSHGLNKLSPETRKYVRTILRCRALVEQTLAMPPMFAPAHEVARQIHVINAFCREAEHLRDPIHDTLWDVLDELLEAHSQVAPRSLFAESVKESIRQTAAELMKMMPGMVRRMAQREFDFILVPPVKRRMLFKMYCMGVFLNGRREKMEKDKLTMPAVDKVYQSQRKPDYEHDDGYYEDMYPEAEEKPGHRLDTAMSLGIFSDAGLDDELALEEAEQWAHEHPLSRGLTNPGFEDDVSAILRDDISDGVSAMMEGVPTGSRSLSQLLGADRPASDRHLYTRLVVVDRPGSGSGGSTTRLSVTPASRASPPTGGDGRHVTSPDVTSSPSVTSPVSGPSPDEASAAAAATTTSPRPTSGQRSRSPAGQPGSRPGSAGRLLTPTGSRPNSASGSLQAEEEWRQSPLPGQIQDPGQESRDGGHDGPVQALSPGPSGQSEA